MREAAAALKLGIDSQDVRDGMLKFIQMVNLWRRRIVVAGLITAVILGVAILALQGISSLF